MNLHFVNGIVYNIDTVLENGIWYIFFLLNILWNKILLFRKTTILNCSDNSHSKILISSFIYKTNKCLRYQLTSSRLLWNTWYFEENKYWINCKKKKYSLSYSCILQIGSSFISVLWCMSGSKILLWLE